MVLKTKDINALMGAVRDAGYRQLRVQSEDFLFEIDPSIDEEPASAETGQDRGPAVRLETKAEEREGFVSVVAPMSGTFYRAPAPDAAPFVEVGSKIKAADVVCIVEVMKLFSSIRADCDGEIVEICSKNAADVETGKVLFWIKPSQDTD